MSSTKPEVSFPVVHVRAAGIDVGSRFHCVSIGEGAGCSREFGVYTADLHELCQWLKSSGIESVAMESTGFYWKQLFLMIQSYGMSAHLVHASYTKNIRGRKPSDMADSQWIWKMHSVGILPSSFQPDEFTEELRTYVRHRKHLIESASHSVSRMQKCLTLMNVHLPIVLTDITGVSGQAILGAILAGERDGATLAALADKRVKADVPTITKALTGNWKTSSLFELKQHWDMYHFHRTQLQACDTEIDQLLQNRVQTTGQAELAYEPEKKKRPQKNDPTFPLATYAFQLNDGIDLMQIDGISFQFVLTLLSEVGTDLAAFPTAKHWVAWLCLCPNKKVTGGKILSSKTKKNKSRLRRAFKQAALAVGKSKDLPLGLFYRKMAALNGKGTAITATARKLAIIVYNIIQKKQAYDPKIAQQDNAKIRQRKIAKLQKTIQQLDVKKEELFLPLN